MSKQKLIKDISFDDHQKVIALLQSYFQRHQTNIPDCQKYIDDIILLSAQFYNNKKEYTNQTIDYKEYKLTMNIIRRALLEIINQFNCAICKADCNVYPPEDQPTHTTTEPPEFDMLAYLQVYFATLEPTI